MRIALGGGKCKFRRALEGLSDGNVLGNIKAVAAFGFLKIMAHFSSPEPHLD